MSIDLLHKKLADTTTGFLRGDIGEDEYRLTVADTTDRIVARRRHPSYVAPQAHVRVYPDGERTILSGVSTPSSAASIRSSDRVFA